MRHAIFLSEGPDGAANMPRRTPALPPQQAGPTREDLPLRSWASPVGSASHRAVALLEGAGARSSFGLANLPVFNQARKAIGDGTG